MHTMSSHQIPSMPRPSPKPHLLSLPTEILQSIYLSCFSPNLPHASPVLTSALSNELIYKLTFLHAFWNKTLPIIVKTQPKQSYEPGPYVRSLFRPLPVPRAEADDDTQARKIELQETVLAHRWCTFHRAKAYFSSALEAVTRDLFLTIDMPLSSQVQTRFDSFIAQYPLASPSTFDITALDGCQITLRCPHQCAPAVLVKYHGPDSRFDQRMDPNIWIEPTDVLVIPSHVLTGQPEWTGDKLCLLQTLCGYVNLRKVQYELSAFHEGMEHAIVQGNYEALLVLIWEATRLAEYKATTSRDETPFKPPEELFRLIARRRVPRLGLSDGEAAGAEIVDDFSVDISLFTLLLRAHAESMPQNDPDITAWTTRLLTCLDESRKDRAISFAQWVTAWDKLDRSSEYIVDRYTLRRGEHEKVRRPLFRGGTVSRKRKEDEMGKRFVEICGGKLESFGKEMERLGRARSA